MKNLIEERNVNLKKMKSAKSKFKKTEEKIMGKISPIIYTMNSAERSVIDSYQEKLRSPELYDLYLMRGSCGGLNQVIPPDKIQSIKIRKDLIKIHASVHICGDWESYSIKIPVDYLKMTKQEILETHKEWTEKTIEKIIKRKTESRRKSIERQIEELKSKLS